MNAITITVHAHADGKISLTGPLHEPDLCVQILADAIKAVTVHRQQAGRALLVAPPNLPLGELVKKANH